ncbi:RolB family protein (plasmid) [Bradyrhizobium sp. CCGUVB23]|nr:RolB family protein [Bradyrhizobium sp. CCGUVB23]
MIQTHISCEINRYARFLNDCLLPAQRNWVDLVRGQGSVIEVEEHLLNEFDNFPCLAGPIPGRPLNQIRMRDATHPEIAYIYLPPNIAAACLLYQTLMSNENQMRFAVQGSGNAASSGNVAALDIPPYAPASDRGSIVQMYRQLGCADVTFDDISYCLIVPVADSMNSMKCGNLNVYYLAPGAFDVIAAVPVYFS